MAVGKGGMGPKHRASGGIAGRREQMRAADLLVAARAKLRDDQIPLLVEEEKAVPVLHDEGVGPADWFAGGRSLEGFPNALAGLHLQATQLPVTADAVNEAVFKERRAHDGVEVGGVFRSEEHTSELQSLRH